MQMEKTGVFMQTDSIQKKAVIGIADKNRKAASFAANGRGKIKL